MERDSDALRAEILEKFRNGEFRYKKRGEIVRLLGVASAAEKRETEYALAELERTGEIARDRSGRYATAAQLGLLRGTVQGNERGFGFFLPEDETEEDIFLPNAALRGALHGDTVLVRPVYGHRGREGEVVAVLARGMKVITGSVSPSFSGIILPDDRRFFTPVRLRDGTAQPGEKVAVEITGYPEGGLPEGRILRVIGRAGELMTEEETIIYSSGMPVSFPDEVLAEAEKAAEEEVVLSGRVDFRADPVITIDGEDSRDFDDAVSVVREGDGYLLSVHIADVSHYVPRGGALDREAYARGTSVYFPDRVIPMLPESLSDGACSLSEGENRYVLSCVMRVNGEGRVTERNICRGVIRSAARMTYTKVQKILDGDEELCARYAFLVPMLRDLLSLADILTAKRRKRGCVDLPPSEAEITYRDGKVEIFPAPDDDAHRIIEECMILANETVAEFAAAEDCAVLYRVHDKPSAEKAEAFAAYLRAQGIAADFDPENVRPGDYSRVLSKVSGQPLYPVVSGVMLRSMAKAVYTNENRGHFGLASSCYCHFTSPIRRYPDLIVHRVIKDILDGKKQEKSFRAFIGKAGPQCSACERRAEEAERETDRLYKTWCMRGQIGRKFTGVISGVRPSCLFVLLENTAEGVVETGDLPGGGYSFDEAACRLRCPGHSYALGDRMDVIPVSADIVQRKITFVPADEPERPAKKAGQTGPGKSGAKKKDQVRKKGKNSGAKKRGGKKKGGKRKR